ncbi:hypothetical protein HYV85_01750 [Candidatus Woesearchaeota archaeon]|nr:hypothetical protein [Candidatus Woesearchaeota archaeon]
METRTKQCAERFENGNFCGKKVKKGDFCYCHKKGWITRNTKHIPLAFILGSIIIPLLLFFYGGDILDWWMGYKVKLDIQDRPDRIVTEDGKDYLKVEIENKGGYTLNEIRGKLTFYCSQQGTINGQHKFNSISGEATLKSGHYSLLKGANDFLYFQNDTLTGMIKDSTLECSDASIFVVKYNKISPTLARFSSAQLVEFFNNIPELRVTNFTSEKISMHPCVYCNLTVTVYSNETQDSAIFKRVAKTSFEKSGLNAYPGMLINWPTPVPEIPVDNSAANSVAWSLIGVFDFNKCKNMERLTCDKYICEEANRNNNLEINCSQTLSSYEINIPADAKGSCNIPVPATCRTQ